MKNLKIDLKTNNKLPNIKPDIENLCNNLFNNTDNQISGILLDLLSYTPLQLTVNPKRDLESFQKLITFITQLGWIEHTGDWDPYLIIEFNNGDKFETEPGYYDFIIDGEGITVIYGTEEEDGDEEASAYFDFTELQSIVLMR